MQKIYALRYISRCVASTWEMNSECGIDLDAKIGVIAILDEDADAFLALIKDHFEATAAIYGGGFGFPTHVRNTAS